MQHRSAGVLVGALILSLGLAPSSSAQGVKSDLAPGGGPVYSGPTGQGAQTAASAGDLGELYARAHFKLQQARRAKDKGDLAGSALALHKILKMRFPQDDKSRRFLGPIAANRAVLLKSMGKYREAAGAIDEGLEILEKPGAKKVYHVMLLYSLRGEVLEQLGQPQAASQAHRRAAELEAALDAEN